VSTFSGTMFCLWRFTSVTSTHSGWYICQRRALLYGIWCMKTVWNQQQQQQQQHFWLKCYCPVWLMCDCDGVRSCLYTHIWKCWAAELPSMASELEQLRQEAEQLKTQIRVGTCDWCLAINYFLCECNRQ